MIIWLCIHLISGSAPRAALDLLISFDRPWCRAPWLPPSSSRLAGFRGRISHPEAGSLCFSFDFDHSHPSKKVNVGVFYNLRRCVWGFFGRKQLKTPNRQNYNFPIFSMRFFGACNPRWSPIFWRKRWANWRCRLLAAATSVRDLQWSRDCDTKNAAARWLPQHDKSGAWWRLCKNIAWCIQLDISLRKLYIHR